MIRVREIVGAPAGRTAGWLSGQANGTPDPAVAGSLTSAAGCGLSRLRLIAIAAGLLATIGSSISSYPHQLAYFNEVSGGPENGYKHLLGSNLDWGQDLLFVRDWANSQGLLPGALQLMPYSGRRIMIEGVVAESDVRWKIVSANKVFGNRRDWRKRCREPRAHRITFALWGFPGTRSTATQAAD